MIGRVDGYLHIAQADGKVIEHDTFSCGHCSRVVVVPPKADPASLGGWCWSCTTLLCPTCAAQPACVPLERWLQRQESRDQFLRSVGV